MQNLSNMKPDVQRLFIKKLASHVANMDDDEVQIFLEAIAPGLEELEEEDFFWY